MIESIEDCIGAIDADDGGETETVLAWLRDHATRLEVVKAYLRRVEESGETIGLWVGEPAHRHIDAGEALRLLEGKVGVEG